MLDIKRYVTKLDDGRFEVTVIPPKWAGVGDGASVILTADQYSRFVVWLKSGAMIQEALPDLSASDREILMTGIDPETWDKLFKEKD